MEGRGTPTVDSKGGIFYGNDGVVASTDPVWLQSAFNLLSGMFDRVGLWMNVENTAGMVCRTCWAEEVQADEAYTWQMAGEGCIFKEQQRERVLCPECRKDMDKGSLMIHRQTQHDVANWRWGSEEDKAYRGGDDPRTYKMAFPTRVGPRPCPVKGCSGLASSRT